MYSVRASSKHGSKECNSMMPTRLQVSVPVLCQYQALINCDIMYE